MLHDDDDNCDHDDKEDGAGKFDDNCDDDDDDVLLSMRGKEAIESGARAASHVACCVNVLEIVSEEGTDDEHDSVTVSVVLTVVQPSHTDT